MNTIKVDLSKIKGEIKPLHGVNCAPYIGADGPNQVNTDKYFKEGHIPYCRLHDTQILRYGGPHYVDVTGIFPDFDADENDPANYDFYYTDEYIKAIQDSGSEAYYRLGVSIEWGSKKYVSIMPTDFHKWARICEHIIMHYNKGWADGFHFDIKYWEIWNEPENPGNQWGSPMWRGKIEEFFDLYRIASKHLKEKFPEIKVGGYGSCGFYTLTREKVRECDRIFIPFFIDFLDMVKAENLPFDFFSWHIYTGDERELLTHAEYVRKTLDSYGFVNTEAHLNEWNIHSEGRGFPSKHTMEGASFNAAVLSMLQETNLVDKAMYYDFQFGSMYTGFIDPITLETEYPWYSFVAYGELYALKNHVDVKVEGERIYATAATNGKTSGVLISNFQNEDGCVETEITGIPENSKVTVLRLRDGEKLEEDFAVSASGTLKLKLKLPLWQVAYIKIN